MAKLAVADLESLSAPCALGATSSMNGPGHEFARTSRVASP